MPDFNGVDPWSKIYSKLDDVNLKLTENTKSNEYFQVLLIAMYMLCILIIVLAILISFPYSASIPISDEEIKADVYDYMNPK